MTQLPVPSDRVVRTPVFDARRKAVFCDHLALAGNVRLACRAAGVSPPTAYKARREDVGFALAWDAALLLAREHAEQVLAERALDGVEEEVFYHGEPVAMRRRYDSRLLLAHLARLDRLAEDEEARRVALDFDAALERLKAGEAVLPAPAGEGAEAAVDADWWRDYLCDEGEGDGVGDMGAGQG